MPVELRHYKPHRTVKGDYMPPRPVKGAYKRRHPLPRRVRFSPKAGHITLRGELETRAPYKPGKKPCLIWLAVQPVWHAGA